MASRVIKRILDRADGLVMGESRGGDPLVSIEWPMPGSSLPGVAQACVSYGELMDAGGRTEGSPVQCRADIVPTQQGTRRGIPMRVPACAGRSWQGLAEIRNLVPRLS